MSKPFKMHESHVLLMCVKQDGCAPTRYFGHLRFGAQDDNYRVDFAGFGFWPRGVAVGENHNNMGARSRCYRCINSGAHVGATTASQFDAFNITARSQ